MGEPLSTFLRPLLTVIWKVLPWALRHPFVLRPHVWWFALIASLLVGGLLVLADAGAPIVFLPLGLALLIIAAGLLGWHRLRSATDVPLVLVTEFAASTPTGREAAQHHRDAAVRRLTDGPLGDHVQVRSVPVAVDRRQAKRLLDAVPAIAVVFGSVKAIAAQGTWELQLLVRWPGDETAPAHVTWGGDDLVIENFDRRTTAPDHHEAVIEPGAPLSRLIAERFEANHVDRVEGTLLALVATAIDDDQSAAELLRAAQRYRSQLSVRTRAALEMVRARTETFSTGTAMLDAIEAAGLRDADHVDLWNFLSGMSYLGLLAGEVPIERHARFAERAVAADRDNPTALYNLAEANMARSRPAEALEGFAAAAEHPEYRSRYYVHFARGIAAYNVERFVEARDAYRLAVALRATARGFLYLADAHRRIGEEADARKNYRRALQLQPTLVDAHRGYWYVEDPSDEPPPLPSWWFDSAYRVLARLRPRRASHVAIHRLLRLHYRRHPEDSRIHFMLGAHALLLERFDEAEQRLRFAYDLVEGVDLEALARLVVVRALQGRIDEAREGLAELRRAPHPATGDPPDEEDLVRRVVDLLSPFFDRPQLTALPGAEELRAEIVKAFPEVLGESNALPTSAYT